MTPLYPQPKEGRVFTAGYEKKSGVSKNRQFSTTFRRWQKMWLVSVE
jgi:hypothetical protein